MLEGESIEESSTQGNWFWGAATVVGGASEMVGGAVLLLAPEPTTVTKIAGGALALHGADTASAGIMQVVSGHTHTTLTSQSVTAAAEALGADPQTAGNVGFAIDIGVPLVAGFAGAFRALAIRRGVVTLTTEEAAGGHTIARHVGRTEAQMRARLAAQPGISAASTFKTLEEVGLAVGEALRANKNAIMTWTRTAAVGQTKAFTYDAGRAIGEGVLRSIGKVTEMTKIVVVVRKVIAGNRVYLLHGCR
jgi:hypothetical protein